MSKVEYNKINTFKSEICKRRKCGKESKTKVYKKERLSDKNNKNQNFCVYVCVRGCVRVRLCVCVCVCVYVYAVFGYINCSRKNGRVVAMVHKVIN